MPDAIEVRKVALSHVSDANGLAELIDEGVFDADRVVAVIGKTEGNGGVNDYTRIIADRAFREVLVAKGSRSDTEVKQIPIVWSGGTDGVISPHATIFATVPAERAEQTGEPRLTVGFAMSETLLPEDIGRVAMITKVADAVKVAMKGAGIDDPRGRALRPDQDPAAHHPHDPRRQGTWRNGVDRGNTPVDGSVQRVHRLGDRRRAR